MGTSKWKKLYDREVGFANSLREDLERGDLLRDELQAKIRGLEGQNIRLANDSFSFRSERDEWKREAERLASEVDRLRAEAKRLTTFEPFEVVCLNDGPSAVTGRPSGLVCGKIYKVLSARASAGNGRIGYTLEGVPNENEFTVGWSASRFIKIVK